jgi:oligosaccharyltransferase complex subunit beta
MRACLRQGHYFTSFKVPDVYGVYKFMVTYHRQGYTALDLTQTVRCTLLPACS